jgi:hypothetical protein
VRPDLKKKKKKKITTKGMVEWLRLKVLSSRPCAAKKQKNPKTE